MGNGILIFERVAMYFESFGADPGFDEGGFGETPTERSSPVGVSGGMLPLENF